jgi:rhomboid protease GluP
MFVRQESFRVFIRLYPIVSVLIALHFLLFAIINYIPNGQMVLYYGVGQNGLIGEGEYWRILTPIFLHQTFPHLLFNSFSLYLFGPALERMIGKPLFLFSYVGAGVIANIVTYFLENSYYTHLGASGAIYGLFGIYLYMSFYRKDLIDRGNAQLVLTILAIGFVMSFFTSNINVLGHLFGLLGGAALAPVVLRKAKPFSIYSITVEHPSDEEIQFNPNRWKRRRRFNTNLTSKIIWGFFILLVVVGVLVRMI